MASQTTTQLAEAYRVAQAQVASEAAATVGLAFRTLLKANSLDKGFAAYALTAAKVINNARLKAAGLGGAFYLAHRNAAGVLDAMPEIAWAGNVRPAQLTTSLLVTGPVAVKRALKMGATLPQALKTAEVKTVGAAYRHTANAGRGTIHGTIFRDPKALGWARVSDGRPCAFCAMLCSRGAVYGTAQTAGLTDAGERYHDRCGCFVVPIYRRDDPIPGLGPELATLWETSQKAKAPGVSPAAAFRAAYAEKYPEGSNPSDRIADATLQKHRDEAAANRKAAEEAAATAATEAEAVAQAEAEKAAAVAAAEKAAKEAAKQAAKVKKWLGKPAPKAPAKPKPPQVDEARHFDGWLAKVTARYDAIGTGKAFSTSFNYSYVETAISKWNTDEGLAAAKYLHANQYLDDALLAEYTDRIVAVQAAVDGAQTTPEYLKALKSYKNLSTRFKRYTEEWREVNGVTGGVLKGMTDDVLVHGSFDEGDAWALTSVKTPDGDEREALTKYTGSSYTPWNDALRKHADGSTLPPGSWESWTERADAAFAPIAEDVIVHRGTSFLEFAFADGTRTEYIPPPDPRELIGSVQAQHGYMSTSVGHQSAFSYNPVQMVIRLPAGHRTSYVKPFSQYPTEYEMLLQRSTLTFIHDVYQRGGQWVVEVEVLPEGSNPADFAGATPMPRPAKPDA